MLIYLVLGVILLVLVVLGAIMLIDAVANKGYADNPAQFYLVLVLFLIVSSLSTVCFVSYSNTLIDKAMSNMEIGNYTKTEYYENGECYKTRFRIGNIDVD